MAVDGPDDLALGDDAEPDTKGGGPNVCPDCGGTGRVGAEVCEACAGAGHLDEVVKGG